MFDEIKKAADEIERVELEAGKKVDAIVKEFDSEYGIIGLRKSDGYMAQVYEVDQLKAIADGDKIEVIKTDDDYFPYELELELEGITFFTILTREEYKSYLKGQSDDDVTEYEPEEARARLTEYERGLRDSGHKQSDFL